MPWSDEPVRVVQCPRCGGRVEGAQPGAVVACDYCGATLQMTVGASGNPIARLASIDDSTAFLARTEAVKRVRAQLQAQETLVTSALYQLEQLPRWEKTLQTVRERLESNKEAVKTTKKAEGEGKRQGYIIGGFLFLYVGISGMCVWQIAVTGRAPEGWWWWLFLCALGPWFFVYGLATLNDLLRRGGNKREEVMELENTLDRLQDDLAELEGQRDEHERVHLQWQRHLAKLEDERDQLQRRLDELESGLDEVAGRL